MKETEIGAAERKQAAPERRHLEFSKLIVILAIAMWVTVNVFGMVMMWITLNLSPMVYVIGSVDAVMAVICATYSYKAKAENMIKLKKLYGIDTVDLADAGVDVPRNYINYEKDAPMYEDASIV